MLQCPIAGDANGSNLCYKLQRTVHCWTIRSSCVVLLTTHHHCLVAYTAHTPKYSYVRILTARFSIVRARRAVTQWRRSVIKSRGSRPEVTSLPPSILLVPFPLVDSTGGLGRARSPAVKHVDAIYTAKQLYKIHIDV